MEWLPDNYNEFLELRYFDNTLLNFGLFVLTIFLGLLFKKLISKLVSRILYRLIKKYSAEITVVNFKKLLLKPLQFFTFLIFIYVAFSFIHFPKSWHIPPADEFGIHMILIKIYGILFVSSIIWIGLRFMDSIGVIMAARALKTESKVEDQLVPFAIDALKVVVVILGIFLILGAVFGLNITSLIAGLGIGGIAIALAAKDTLENLLGSFTIFLDKPFTVGDLVKTNDVTGFVEKIGFRSTRIRTMEKSWVTIPNKKIVESELDNLSMRTFRRVNFFFTFSYDTKVDAIKSTIKDLIALFKANHSCNEESTAILDSFGDFGYKVFVDYYLDSPDYNDFLLKKEYMTLQIASILLKNGVQPAQPSYIQTNENNNKVK
jgi:MscS family membrane protein